MLQLLNFFKFFFQFLILLSLFFKLQFFARILLIHLIQNLTHLPELLRHHLANLFVFLTLNRPQLPIIFLKTFHLFLKGGPLVLSLHQPALEILADINMKLSFDFEGVTFFVPGLPSLILSVFEGLEDQLFLGQLACQKFVLVF